MLNGVVDPLVSSEDSPTMVTTSASSPVSTVSLKNRGFFSKMGATFQESGSTSSKKSSNCPSKGSADDRTLDLYQNGMDEADLGDGSHSSSTAKSVTSSTIGLILQAKKRSIDPDYNYILAARHASYISQQVLNHIAKIQSELESPFSIIVFELDLVLTLTIVLTLTLHFFPI